MVDISKTREELLGEVEGLRRQLAAAQRDHQIIVDGLREEHRLAEAAWRSRMEVLEAKLAGRSSEADPPISGPRREISLEQSDGERQRLLSMVQEQAEELRIANEELTVQTEELRISNEELAAQAETLEEQKHDLEHLAWELKAERALLESVLEQMPASVMIVLAPAGPILLSNHLAKKVWGESWQGLSNLDSYWGTPRYHPDGQVVQKEDIPLWRSLTMGEVVMDEEMILRPRGRTPIHLSVSSAPVRDHQGNIVAGVVTHSDITARKAAEAEINRLASFPQLNPNPVLELDPMGAITYCNPAGLAVLNSLGEAGRPEAFLPVDLADLLIAGSEQKKGYFYREVRIKDAVFAEDISYAAPLGVFRIYARDITERQRQEEEIRRFANFPLTNPSPVLEVNEVGEVIFANPAAIQVAEKFGLPEGAGTFLPPDFKERFAAAREGGPREYSFDLALGDVVFAVTFHLPHDLPTARIYAMDITERKRVEEALKESEERYRSLFANTHAVMLLIDPETGAIVDANPAACSYYGYTQEELTSLFIMDINTLPPKEVFGEMRQACENQRQHFFFRHRLATGEVRDVEVFSGPVNFGGRIFLYSIVHDISARKAAEEALRESEARLQTVFENLNEGLVFADLDGRLFHWNPAAVAIHGFDSEEECQRLLPEFIDTFELSTPEDGILPVEQWPLARILRGETLRDWEVDIRRKDNGWRRVFNYGGTLARDPEGHPLLAVVSVSDITDRKGAEKALRESREDLNRAQAVALTGSWRLDTRRNDLTWSDETYRMFGIPPGTPLTYETFLAVVHPQDRKYVDQQWTAALSGAPYDIEHRIVVGDTVKWVREKAELEFDPQGELVGGFGTVQDITERKAAELERQQLLEKLQESQEELQVINEELQAQTEELQEANQDLLAAHTALKESEARFRGIFEHMTEGVVLHEIIFDEPGRAVDYRIVAINPAFSIHTGLQPEQVLGRLASVAYGTGEAPYLETYARVAQTGEPASFETFFTPLQRHFSISATSPKTGQFITVFEDVTARKRLEAALRESEERYRTLVELSPEAVLVFAEGKYVFANQAAADLFGAATPAQMVGQDVLALVPLDFREFVSRRIKEVLAGDKEKDQEAQILRLDGQAVDVEACAQAILYRGRKAILLIFRNITERKRALKALRESREDLNRAQAIGKIGSWRMDVQRNELTWSDENHRIFGIPPGTTMTYETFLGTVHPEDREYVDRKWMAALEGEPYDIEHRIVVGDKVKWVREQAGLEFDSQGKLLGGFGTTQDITERKEAEQALRESEARLRMAQQVARIGTFELNIQTGVNTWTPELEAMYGLSPGGFGRTQTAWEDLVHPEDRSEAIRQVEIAFETGEPMEGEWRVVWPDGSVHWLAGRWQVFKDKSGEPLRMTGINLDITERKLAEEALKKSNQRLDLLAETASLLLASASPQEVAQAICQKVMAFLDCDACFNFIVDENQGRLRLNTYAGIPAEVAKEIEWLDYGMAVCGCAASEGNRIVTEHIQTTPDPRTALVKSYGIQAYACHPLLMQGRVLGTLSFGTRSRPRFTSDELDVMKAVSDQVAVAIDRKRTEEAVLRAKEEWERTFDAVPDYIALLDKEHHITRMNRAMAELLGKPQEEVIGLTCYEAVHGLEEAPDYCPHSKAMANGRAHSAEVTEFGRTFAVSVSPIFGPEGQLIGGVHVARDITASKEAEAALQRAHDELEERVKERTAELRQQTELVQDLYNNAPCGYHSLDADGAFVQINDTELGWLGYERDEIVGRMKFSDFLTAESIKVFQENFPLFKERGWVRDLEYALVRKDGTVMPVLLSATAIKDEAGNYLMSRSTVYDITVRKRAQEALEWERQRLYSVLERIPAHVALLRPDHSFAYVNGEFVRRFGEPDSKRCFEHVGQEHPCRECEAMAVFRTGQPVIWEWAASNGRHYQVYDYPFNDVDGSPLVLKMGVDITARKEAEVALRESEERLRYLAGRLLHAQETERRRLAIELHDDLGQSLMVLKMQLRAIEKTVPLDQWQTREELSHSLGYLNGVVENVRRLSRNLRPSVLEDLGLAAGLRVLVEEFRKYHEMELSLEMDDIDGLFFREEEINIYRIFQETLTNIVKHAQAQRVNIVIRRQAEGVSFKVADDGRGFDVEQVLAKDGSKQGLGLAALEERVNMLGGTLQIRTQINQGTEILFEVPYSGNPVVD
ncbi:MAG: PAS domain S-box protein [Thermodesulfobacteriota bacterium]